MDEIEEKIGDLPSGETKEQREAKRHVRRILEQKREDVQRDDKPYASMLRDAVQTLAAEASVE